MANYEGVRVPNPLRAKCIRSVFTPAPLDDVALAVAEATSFQRRLYIERLGELWRWSLIHSGGGYPLLRLAALYLEMDYQALFVGFRTVTDGLCILCQDPEVVQAPDRWSVVEFDGPTSPEEVARRIRAAFQPSGE